MKIGKIVSYICKNNYQIMASRFFTKLFLVVSGLSISLIACSKTPQVQSRVRIGSYNLRMQHLDKGEDDWSLRRGRVVRSINDNDFDVFGVQELTVNAQQELTWDLGAKYACLFFSPYSQDGVGNKAQGIFFNKKRFKLLEYHYFWPADNPDIKTENDHYKKDPTKSYIRGGMCIILKEKSTGKKFFFMNSHAPLNRADHIKYAHVYIDMEKKYNKENLPSFFVGDLNARPDHPASVIYREYWKDSADTWPEQWCTMNSFKTDPAQWPADKRIDYVYYRNIADPSEYRCNQTLYDGRCASDHFPVWADFKL